MRGPLPLAIREKISQALKGRVCPEDTRRKISQARLERHVPNGRLGTHLSNETKAKISETHKRMISDGILLMPSDKRNANAAQVIAKTRLANTGQHRSAEIKLKMGEAQRKCGNKPPPGSRHWTDEDRLKCSERQRGISYGRHHSIQTRLKLSIMRRGPNGSNWQGGICESTELLRHTIEYKIWREAIFGRDNYTCRECKRRGGRLHPHHIKSFAKFPELRFDVNNGFTLCEDCHKKTDNFGGRAIKAGKEEPCPS